MEQRILSTTEKKKTLNALKNEFERYRFYKFTLIPRWDEMGEGTDPVYTQNQQQKIKDYCERMDQAVNQLPIKERNLIQERYLSVDSEYLTDLEMYTKRFDPPISARTYDRYRKKAILKLAFYLGLSNE